MRDECDDRKVTRFSIPEGLKSGCRSIEHGVSWYAGRRYAFDGQQKPFARFSFARLNERELPEAVKRMAAARP
ncbi:MAG: hypothetical protein ACRD2N_25865 [Vicinamibacterales bacterium]